MKTYSPLWIRITALVTALLVLWPAQYMAMAVTPPAADTNGVYLDLYAQTKGKDFLEWLTAIDGNGEGGFITHNKTDKFGRPTRAVSAAVFSTKEDWWMRVDFNKQSLPSRIIDSNGNEILFSKYRGIGKADLSGAPFSVSDPSTGDPNVSPDASVKVKVRNQIGQVLFAGTILIPLVILNFRMMLRSGLPLYDYMAAQSLGTYSGILPTGVTGNTALFAITGKMFGIIMIGALLASTMFLVPDIIGMDLSTFSLVATIIGLALQNGAGGNLAFLGKFIPMLAWLYGSHLGLLLAFITGGTFLLAGGAGGFWEGYAPYNCLLSGLIFFFAQKPVRKDIPLMMRMTLTVLCLFTFWAVPSA